MSSKLITYIHISHFPFLPISKLSYLYIEVIIFAQLYPGLPPLFLVLVILIHFLIYVVHLLLYLDPGSLLLEPDELIDHGRVLVGQYEGVGHVEDVELVDQVPEELLALAEVLQVNPQIGTVN